MRDHEEDVPAEYASTPQEARVPRTNADQERPQGSGGAPAKGPQAADGLISDRPGRLARIRRRADFQEVYRAGFRVSGDHLVVFVLYRPERSGSGPRLGITASRKVGTAVVRSRSRRRVRELFRLSGIAGWRWPADLVVNVRRGCHEALWSELVADWSRLMAVVARRLGRQDRAAGEPRPPVVK